MTPETNSSELLRLTPTYDVKVDEAEVQRQVQETKTLQTLKATLLDRMLKYVVGNKVNQVISIMLQHYANNGIGSKPNQAISKETLDLCKEEIRSCLTTKIQVLLESVFNNEA